jgi:hypothetical protein
MTERLVLADVMDELEALASIARRKPDHELEEACTRVEAMLDRLREQFLFDITGPVAPSLAPVDLARARTRRRPDTSAAAAAEGLASGSMPTVAG